MRFMPRSRKWLAARVNVHRSRVVYAAELPFEYEQLFHCMVIYKRRILTAQRSVRKMLASKRARLEALQRLAKKLSPSKLPSNLDEILEEYLREAVLKYLVRVKLHRQEVQRLKEEWKYTHFDRNLPPLPPVPSLSLFTTQDLPKRLRTWKPPKKSTR